MRTEGGYYIVRKGQITWLKDVIILAVNTGLRLGELVALQWQDISGQWLIVRSSQDHRTKSGRSRQIPLTSEVIEMLEKLRPQNVNPNTPVFVGYNGKALDKDYVSKRFKKYSLLASCPPNLHFHDLRHTTASWLVMADVPLYVVQHILGHQKAETTAQYAHLAPSFLVDAMDKLSKR